MRWILTQFATGMRNAFKDIDVRQGSEQDLETTRKAMLDSMQTVAGPQATRAPLWRAISGAKDGQSLWYLRSDLMAYLSAHKGEPFAKEQLSGLTKNFRGQIPSAQFASALRQRQF